MCGVVLRKRLLARFERGFPYSLLIAMVGGALMFSTIYEVVRMKADDAV